MKNFLYILLFALVAGLTFVSLELSSQNSDLLTKLTKIIPFLPPRVGPAVINKSEDEMTTEELEAKRALEKELSDNAPTHQLTLKDEKIMRGTLEEDKPSYVVFSESYRETGKVSAKIKRSRILKIETLTNAVPEITYRDVLFKIEFPEMKFYKSKPYSIMTDESFFKVQGSVAALQKLYKQMYQRFGMLMNRDKERNNIQVLFFSKEEDFVPYRERYAPELKGSIGFYTSELDRLIVYNQQTSTQLAAIRKMVDTEAAKYKKQFSEKQQQAQINEWVRGEQKRLAWIAKEQTYNIIRHEGAHQIFFATEIHSIEYHPPAWIIEGMAVYCEPDALGNKNPVRSQELREANRTKTLIPLSKLMNMEVLDSSLAYSESWAFVYFLMRSRSRKGFLEYLRFLQDPANKKEIEAQSSLDLLAGFLNTTQKELEEAWIKYQPALF